MVVRPKKKKMTKKERAKHLDNRDLAHRIQATSFKGVAGEIGDRMTAARAHKIVKLMKGYGYEDIDPDLIALAEEKREGRYGGPVKPPKPGEEREYVVGVNTRIGIPLGILGKQPGDRVKVKYYSDKVVVKR